MKKIMYIIPIIAGLLTGNAQAHSDAFKPAFVQKLVAPYLSVQIALSKDNFDGAQAGANEFLGAMNKGPSEKEAEEEVADLVNPARQISTADDIAAARTAFLDLSNQMTALIKHVGISGEDKLYKAFCPMAFSGKGGAWIQSDKSIANPYYGSMMYRCGSVKEQIAGSTENEKDEHSGHKH